MLPKAPYFDQVAAGLSLFLALKDKKASIVCDTPMTVEFNKLVGVNKITAAAGSKNLVIKIADYPASQVERVNYDIDGNDLFLTVFPLPGMEPPTKESIQVNYTGISADTVILIGGANESHFPLLSQKDFVSMKIVHIGISDITLPGKQVLSLAKSASSISEVVAEYLSELENAINPDIATNLFMGLVDGTRNFTNSTVTSETFKAASDLLQKGARREQLKAFQPKPAPAPASSDQGVPKSWNEPKIYKGTSVS